MRIRAAAVCWLAILTVGVPGAALATPGAPADGAERSAPARARVARTSAAAELRAGRGTEALPPGARVPLGRELAAGDAPVELELAGGARVRLEPGSRAVVNGVVDVVPGRGGKRSALRIEARAGELAFELPATPAKAAVLVSTGELLVALGAGARARVVPVAGKPAGLAVGLFEGTASWARKGAWHPLAPGEVADLREEGPPSAPRPMLPAPTWSSERPSCGAGPLAVVTAEDGRAPVGAHLSKVDGAAGYRIEVARDAQFADVLYRREVPPERPELVTPPLPPGRYLARATTRGPEGLLGAPGPARALRIVRVKLPPGASVREDAWTLPPARDVVLDDPAGLELEKGRSGFMQAPASFGLRGEEPVRCALRLRGEPATVPFLLRPRTLHAQVEIGPKWAVWPFDAVDVTVRIEDGAVAVEDVVPDLHVRVDLREVPVKWTHRGNVWQARLAPHPPPGPWVVRVEALDPYGAELGRGFLEVIGPEDAPKGALTSR
jgi:hypothetical protein